MGTREDSTNVTSFHPVDHNSAMPLYLQIVGQVEAGLRTKRVTPSQMLPAEPVLCEQFDVSRKTLRRATDHLVRLGLIRRIHGVGTVVTDEAWVDGFSAVRSIHQDLMSARRTPETKLISAAPGLVDSALSERTGFPVGTAVLVITRLRLAEGRVLAILGNILLSRIGALDEAELAGSFLDIMRRRGLDSHIVRQEISAHQPTQEQADLLEISRETPILCETLQNVDADGEVLNYSTNFYHPVNHRMMAVTFVEEFPGGMKLPFQG